MRTVILLFNKIEEVGRDPNRLLNALNIRLMDN